MLVIAMLVLANLNNSLAIATLVVSFLMLEPGQSQAHVQGLIARGLQQLLAPQSPIAVLTSIAMASLDTDSPQERGM